MIEAVLVRVDTMLRLRDLVEEMGGFVDTIFTYVHIFERDSFRSTLFKSEFDILIIEVMSSFVRIGHLQFCSRNPGTQIELLDLRFGCRCLIIYRVKFNLSSIIELITGTYKCVCVYYYHYYKLFFWGHKRVWAEFKKLSKTIKKEARMSESTT